MPGTPHNSIRRMVAALCPLLLIVVANTSHAGPWINPGDETLRHHLQVLSDAGAVTVPITTWPLMWSGIKQDLESLSPGKLSSAQALSLSYVRFALRRDTGNDIRYNWRGDVRQDPRLFTDFGDSQRDQAETSLSADWMGKHLAGRLKISYTDDANDDPNAKLDGSYISTVLGNWAFTAGSIERWWGPGWQNSLILSTNARPAPSLSLQRNHSAAFETPWLSWIGPWHLETFMGRLENNREISHALLWGLRITFRPIQPLEIGLTRTAQWGGEGRPRDFSTFTDLLLGRDNRGDEGIEQRNEPGNQLGGIDWRLSGTFFGDTGVGLYSQWIGEDESGGTPSRFSMLIGADASIILTGIHHRIYLEFSDTTAEGFKGGDSARPNISYEHSIYKNGYRYRIRSIASATDNDTRMLTLAHDLHLNDDQQISWSLAKVEVNRDGTDTSPPGGNTLSRNVRTNLWLADARYSILINPWQLSFGVDYQSEDLTYGGDSIGGASAYFAWEARW
ncbi:MULTISPECIES: capsule assembly Wzi family protein [unclassified Ketobacter]|uniref:capsule assembly Wzi family protein n=1 Tax=unclassified Ketobacter TaxID=2639109 RepID=UPI0025B8A080|nr:MULTISPECIES: capsule assembly Wzi family protein [unclassified Ketobacter]